MKFRLTVALGSVFLLGCGREDSAVREQLRQAQTRALDFLAANQQLNGGFISYEWLSAAPNNKHRIETPFTVSQVVYSLGFCGDQSNARVIRDRAAGWLVRQREEPGLWRYHGKMDKLPPDADDTAMGWIVLKREGYSIRPEAIEAVRASRNEANLFNTWMGDPSARVDSREPDAIVNLNVLLFFSFIGGKFDDVCAYLLNEVKTDHFRRGSIYYPSQWAFTYAFSRAYADGGVGCLKPAAPKVLQTTLSFRKEDGGWGSDYETVLAALTLLNLKQKGAVIEQALKLLAGRQMADGGWEFDAAYTGADRSMSYGSRAVTTALCVEAFAKYLRR